MWIPTCGDVVTAVLFSLAVWPRSAKSVSPMRSCGSIGTTFEPGGSTSATPGIPRARSSRPKCSESRFPRSATDVRWSPPRELERILYRGGTAEPEVRRMPEVTHPEKVMYPDDGITKGDVVEYYRTVADAILPHLEGRPLTLQRFPSGIDGEGFMQKNAGKYFPDSIERVEVP